MRPVNLLPRDAPGGRRRRLPPAPVALAAAAPLLAAGLVYLGWSAEHAKVQSRSGDLAAVRSQVEALRPVRGAAAVSQLASLRAARTAAVDDVLGKRLAWDGLLDAIARVLPSDVWLSDLSVQSPAPLAGASTGSSSASAGSQGLELTGSARSQVAVAHALQRLAVVPGLSGVTLGETTSSGTGKQAVVQFQISATVGGGS